MTQENRFAQKSDEELRMANIEARNAQALRTIQRQVINQRFVAAQRAIETLYSKGL